MQPSPDEVVWCMNSTYERQADGSWRAWLQVLPELAPASGATRDFEVHGSTVDAARTELVSSLLILDGDEFRARYARPYQRKHIPDEPWPPDGDVWHGLGFEPLNG